MALTTQEIMVLTSVLVTAIFRSRSRRDERNSMRRLVRYFLKD